MKRPRLCAGLEDEMSYDDRVQGRGMSTMAKTATISGVAAAALLGGYLTMVTTIDSNQIGVKQSAFSGLQQDVLTQGMNITAPWISVHRYSIGERIVSEKDIATRTTNGRVDVDADFYFRMKPEGGPSVHQNHRANADEKVLSALRSALRNQAMRVTTEVATSEPGRQQLEVDVAREANAMLVEFGVPYDVKVVLRDITLPPELEAARLREQVNRADQAAQQVQFETERQALAFRRERAGLEEQANIAQAKANDAITRSYTPMMIQMRRAEALNTLAQAAREGKLTGPVNLFFNADGSDTPAVVPTTR
jgi:hypothetical protein